MENEKNTPLPPSESDERTIAVELIQNSAETMFERLGKREMVVAVAQNEFLFVIEFDAMYEVFMHIPGTPEGQRKAFPKSEQSEAMIKSLTKLADEMYAVEFNRKFDITSVMAAAEQAVIGRRVPETIEFFVPGQENPPVQ